MLLFLRAYFSSTAEVPTNLGLDITVDSVWASGSSVFLIDNNGEVYAFGDNTFNVLGLGNLSNPYVSTPTQVTALSGLNIIQVESTGAHSAAIDGMLLCNNQSSNTWQLMETFTPLEQILLVLDFWELAEDSLI
jgi:hypothetical protein